MLPSPIVEALGPRAVGAPYVALRSGIGTPVGESHLVVLDGALRVFARGSLLDELVEHAAVERAHVEETALRVELVLGCATGRSTISLGFGETEVVQELLKHFTPSGPSGESPPGESPVGETASRSSADVRSAEPMHTEPASAIAVSQSTLVDARRNQLEKGARAKSSRKSAVPRTALHGGTSRKQPAPNTKPIPDVTRDATEGSTSSSPMAAWIVLLGLIAIGIGSALKRLLLSP